MGIIGCFCPSAKTAIFTVSAGIVFARFTPGKVSRQNVFAEDRNPKRNKTMMTERNSAAHLRQLDGLRALSVAAVAWWHWRIYWPHTNIPWGEYGVNTFFVISGFLITGILLDNRSETSKFHTLRQFYARRFLRIFPLFYITLAVAMLTQANTGVPESWSWHVSYLSNLYFYLHGWHGSISHFWSLAVEEQFYLLWPFLMIFLPARFVLPVIAASIATAPLFEAGMQHLYPQHEANILAPSCMNTLGMGALLAYGTRHGFKFGKITLPILFTGITAYALWYGSGHPKSMLPLAHLAESCVLGVLVYSAIKGFRGPLGWFLEAGPISYLGKISYGLYIIHGFAALICLHLLTLPGTPHWVPAAYALRCVRIPLLAGVTIGLAALSWRVLEKPLNDLKRAFPYPNKPCLIAEARTTGNPGTNQILPASVNLPRGIGPIS
ncbi:MAG: acyltransferase [Verrucomicrobiota bacterium]